VGEFFGVLGVSVRFLFTSASSALTPNRFHSETIPHLAYFHAFVGFSRFGKAIVFSGLVGSSSVRFEFGGRDGSEQNRPAFPRRQSQRTHPEDMIEVACC
jgi:hypothetical protein